MNKPALGDLRDRALRDVEAGLEHGGIEGCTLALGYAGEVIWEEGFGAAKADTPILMLSITKTVFEAALWKLFERDLSPDTPVVDVIPEFMGGSQPDITVAMIETHQAGFAWHPLDYPAATDRAVRLAAMEGWRLDQPPGAYEYNPVNGGWVLAEIVERVAGRSFSTFLMDEVLFPLGLGNPATVSLGESEEALSGTLFHRNYAGGYTPDPAKRVPMPYGLDTAAGLALGTPGVAGVGTASGIVRLYQAYLHNPRQLWSPTILAQARDLTLVATTDNFGRPMRRSLSFVQAGPRAERYGERTFFGPETSNRAFGHQGQGGQIAWADPATGLSFAFLTNTVVFPPGGCFHPRARELSALAAKAVAT